MYKPHSPPLVVHSICTVNSGHMQLEQNKDQCDFGLTNAEYCGTTALLEFTNQSAAYFSVYLLTHPSFTDTGQQTPGCVAS